MKFNHPCPPLCRRRKAFGLVVLALLLTLAHAGCAATPTLEPTAAPLAEEPTPTVQPSATPTVVTPTPEPTATEQPTSTPTVATPTPQPTATEQPTNTPTPVPPTPEPTPTVPPTNTPTVVPPTPTVPPTNTPTPVPPTPEPTPTTPPPTATLVPTPTLAPTVIPPAPAPPRQDCVDINTAPKEELRRIIHIDEVRADELIRRRPFRSVDQLTRIPGIGPARLRDIKEQGLACVP